MNRIEEREAEEISPFLAQINKFIHSHRLQRRNVLVFSDAGLCRAPTIIAQYLIQVLRVVYIVKLRIIWILYT